MTVCRDMFGPRQRVARLTGPMMQRLIHKQKDELIEFLSLSDFTWPVELRLLIAQMDMSEARKAAGDPQARVRDEAPNQPKP